ncbi:MAG TPA: prephenate dehydratase [Chloroflexia bacterium]|nr:prephenate dehydratase [Chloroflexia bacterium]
MRVAFLGQIGSHSEGAALEYAGAALEAVPCESFGAVFAAVAAGSADRAVLPIENAWAGSIHSNYDLLLQHDLYIVGELSCYIRHNLLALPGVELAAIRRVWSHPQALDQCAAYLAGLRVTREAVADTTAAARRVRDEQRHDTAAIASLRAAALYGLVPLAAGIEDSADNYTRFLILAREPGPPPTGRLAKTSLVFSLEHVPGALYQALAVFARRGLNLTKIESRPLRGRRWEYLFYLDFTAAPADPAPGAALAELQMLAPFLRVLGVYTQDAR